MPFYHMTFSNRFNNISSFMQVSHAQEKHIKGNFKEISYTFGPLMSNKKTSSDGRSTEYLVNPDSITRGR